MKSIARALLAVAALVLSPLAPAQTEDGENQQLYRQALQSIAEGRNTDASETLRRVIEGEPLHAGAWLDLALIQCALGHEDEAERMFEIIRSRFNPSPGIVQLITEARSAGCAHWRPHAQTAFSVGRGIDQNVNQGASSGGYSVTGVPVEVPLTEDFHPKHDQYTVLTADYVSDITSNGTTGYAQFQSRRYDRLGLYNSSSLFAGVDTPWRFGRWTLHGSASLGLITLGHQLYQRQSQVQARIGPPLPLPGSMQFSLTTSLTHVTYLTLSNFDSNTAELRGQFNYRLDDDSASASLARLSDRGGSARPGGNREGWLLNAQWRRRLFGETSGELGYTHQTWKSSSAYSPGFLDQVRDQTTQVLRASINYPLSNTQSLQLEARQVRNKENISIFQYNDRQLQLSWQWQGL
ncbi:bacterial transcriptional activator domain-containing protein [Duganella sp. BJB475]|uniref:bacterial transcriptional activator domain-containing protein n=1 Tax=Duganella sp. BJB475 TaxID=2233914 RepID=UPI000E352CBB|nr:bacterial transcriptional activator domain-containing protein [Duganella sp. BJB475]RFP11902.1 tetratricopeptide repeat protein [Duganella sp. BJB475]RFP30088.1 tetratricopeptide repeat protein [Duganella sp. BJB476]